MLLTRALPMIHRTVTVGMLALIALGCWFASTYPTVHADWTLTGDVTSVHPGSRAATALRVGDRVVAVDGVPSEHARLTFNGKQPGDFTTLLVERGDTRTEVRLPLERAWPDELVDAWISQILALLFWSAGWQALRSARQSEIRPTGVVMGTFFASAGVMLSLGSVSWYAPSWLFSIYGYGLWLLAPLGTLLHLRFPRHRLGKHAAYLYAILFGLGSIGLIGSMAASLTIPFRFALIAAYAWLGLHLVVSIGLLVWGWIDSPTLGERRQLGVVAAGGILALVPLLVANLVPLLLTGKSLSNTNAMMLPVALLPGAYTYALLRHRRLVQDKTLARLLVYAFTAAVVAIAAALVFVLALFFNLQREYLVGIAILVVSVAAGPASRAIEDGLGWLLFGRLRQPLKAAARATDAIDLSIDSDDLGAQVAHILKTQLDIDHCAILMLNGDHLVSVQGSSGVPQLAEGFELPLRSALARLLESDLAVLEVDEVAEKIRATSAQVILSVPWARLIAPLRGHDQLLGLLLFSYRAGTDFLEEEDIAVLKLVTKALGTALHHRRLLFELQEKNAEASELSRELMRVRAEERKRIARDLHDDIIQPMIAAAYAVAAMPDPRAEGIRTTLTELVDRTRNICFELREPALDNLGFAAAARAVISAFAKRTGRRVNSLIAENAAVSVTESISAAALGVLDEALTNASKHAPDSDITVEVQVSNRELTIAVQDAGQGFDVAAVRDAAAQSRHFGLAIMEERAAAVGGSLTVLSSPQRGARVEGRFPLSA